MNQSSFPHAGPPHHHKSSVIHSFRTFLLKAEQILKDFGLGHLPQSKWLEIVTRDINLSTQFKERNVFSRKLSNIIVPQRYRLKMLQTLQRRTQHCSSMRSNFIPTEIQVSQCSQLGNTRCNRHRSLLPKSITTEIQVSQYSQLGHTRSNRHRSLLPNFIITEIQVRQCSQLGHTRCNRQDRKS